MSRVSRRWPADTRAIQWSNREDFARLRAEWLQETRHDTALLPATMVVLAEVGARMGYDRGAAWPSVRRLAADFGWSPATIKRSLAQAIERGWLQCERRGFAGSNRYLMSRSQSISNQVAEAHEIRLGSLGSSVRPMGEEPAIWLMDEPSSGSPVIPHRAHAQALIGLTDEPLTLSRNLNKEPDDESFAEKLGEAAQVEALEPSSITIEEFHLLLGEGDREFGEWRGDRLGPARVTFLMNEVDRLGEKAADQIREAATIADKSTNPATAKSRRDL